MTNEAFSRVMIDAQLQDVGWKLTDGISVHFEYVTDEGTKVDYLLADRHGKALAVLEAKRASINPVEAEGQALDYAKLVNVPFIFLANGDEVWFWEHEKEAHPHQVDTVFSQADLERRMASYKVRTDPMAIEIDRKIAGRDYQKECIDTLCNEINLGRRKLLVEMATGTGKTRTAAALIKRLFEANRITRVLFLVDRNPLARQTEDAFAEHLPDYPAYVLRSGRHFQDEKRITITTLQSMVNQYRKYSSGYFDLIISDECHRSIYGKWSGVLKHFDGVQIGLTATPCVVAQELLDDLADEEDKLFVRDTLRFFEVDRPTYRYTIKQAVSEGYLVPYRIYKAKTVKTAAEGGFPVRRDELDWSAIPEATKMELEELFGDEDEIIVEPSALERAFTIPERNRAMVREFREVLDNGYKGSDSVLRKPQWGKTIVFAVTKRHAETLAHMFDDVFADKKPTPQTRYADFVVSGTENENTGDGRSKITQFKKEEFPQILVSVNMLDTGFDCPEVTNLVLARFTKSAILYQQQRGRGTRKADHIKKTSFTMFDFVGVTDFHGDDEGDIPGDFVAPPKPSDQPKKPRSLIVIDVHDQIDPSTRDWITMDEDGNEVRTEAGEARALELGLRFEEWLLRQLDLTLEQERFLGMVGQQIRANALTWDAFDSGNLLDPPFSTRGGIDWGIGLFGSEARLEEVLADLSDSVFNDPATAPGAAEAVYETPTVH